MYQNFSPLPSSPVSPEQPSASQSITPQQFIGGRPKFQFKTKSVLIALFSLLSVVGVGMAMYLSTQSQDVRQQASGGTYGGIACCIGGKNQTLPNSVECTSAGGKQGLCAAITVTDPNHGVCPENWTLNPTTNKCVQNTAVQTCTAKCLAVVGNTASECTKSCAGATNDQNIGGACTYSGQCGTGRTCQNGFCKNSSATCPTGQITCNGGCIPQGTSCTQIAGVCDDAKDAPKCSGSVKFICSGSKWVPSGSCPVALSPKEIVAAPTRSCAGNCSDCSATCVSGSCSCSSSCKNSSTSQGGTCGGSKCDSATLSLLAQACPGRVNASTCSCNPIPKVECYAIHGKACESDGLFEEKCPSGEFTSSSACNAKLASDAVKKVECYGTAGSSCISTGLYVDKCPSGQWDNSAACQSSLESKSCPSGSEYISFNRSCRCKYEGGFSDFRPGSSLPSICTFVPKKTPLPDPNAIIVNDAVANYVGINADGSVNFNACPDDENIKFCECSDGTIPGPGRYCGTKDAKVTIVNSTGAFIPASFSNYLEGSTQKEAEIPDFTAGFKSYINRWDALLNGKVASADQASAFIYQLGDTFSLGGVSSYHAAADVAIACDQDQIKQQALGLQTQGCGKQKIGAAFAFASAVATPITIVGGISEPTINFSSKVGEAVTGTYVNVGTKIAPAIGEKVLSYSAGEVAVDVATGTYTTVSNTISKVASVQIASGDTPIIGALLDNPITNYVAGGPVSISVGSATLSGAGAYAAAQGVKSGIPLDFQFLSFETTDSFWEGLSNGGAATNTGASGITPQGVAQTANTTSDVKKVYNDLTGQQGGTADVVLDILTGNPIQVAQDSIGN